MLCTVVGAGPGLHREERGAWRREVVFLPPGGDPFYHDPGGRHRATSRPVRATDDVPAVSRHDPAAPAPRATGRRPADGS